uniref:Uncharacterized protein n=1 Tax=Picea sitchensis TaxID=3332 RepID=A0A6B9XUD5_PICSI|nr:hypothetical protein Q903MT_gene3973 [Picea sitchensis]
MDKLIYSCREDPPRLQPRNETGNEQSTNVFDKTTVNEAVFLLELFMAGRPPFNSELLMLRFLPSHDHIPSERCRSLSLSLQCGNDLHINENEGE